MPKLSDRIFDRMFLGGIVTSSQVLRDGYVAVRGDGITVLARPGTGRFIRRTMH